MPPTPTKHFPCSICKKPTDQTCSLCRKVFYCSSEHQQIDWHMRHKMQCEGKIVQNPGISSLGNKVSNSQWVSGSGQLRNVEFIEDKSNQVRTENQSKHFMEMFEQRFIVRKKTLDKYLKFIEVNSNSRDYAEMLQEMAKALDDLNVLSNELLTGFRPQFTPLLEELYGITTSEFILKLDQILDLTLQAKFNLLMQNHEAVRRFLFNVHQQLPQCPQKMPQKLRQVYQNTLKSVIQVSQVHNNDKVTQRLMGRYVAMIQQYEGIWQQVYAYLNTGIWYLKRTYHHKAIKCFTHALELIAMHHRPTSAMDPSLVQSTLHFNRALSLYALNQTKEAFENMQEAYKLRSKAIGKNSIEASFCLEALSRWSFHSKSWQDCLQYAKQCYRVRKLNSTNYPTQLQQIQKLLQSIYSQLKKQKQQQQQFMTSNKPPKYYDSLIPNSKPPLPQEKQKTFAEQESFIKQLSSSLKEEMVPFKLVITPEMAETYSSTQWEKLTQLLEMTDKMMEKEDVRRIIFQSQFTEALDQRQRDAFVKANRID